MLVFKAVEQSTVNLVAERALGVSAGQDLARFSRALCSESDKAAAVEPAGLRSHLETHLQAPSSCWLTHN